MNGCVYYQTMTPPPKIEWRFCLIMSKRNWLSLRHKLFALFLICLLCVIANADPQCAIESLKTYGNVEWMDHNGLLKLSEDELVSDCKPCNISVYSGVNPSIKSITNVVCYKADNSSLTHDTVCGWYQNENEEKKTTSRKFPYISGLKVLSLTKHKIEEWTHIDKVFEDLIELEYLYLENNYITGWNFSGNSTLSNLPNLRVLSLAYNPIENLTNNSFLWLQNSSIELLNLRGCSRLRILDYGVLRPLRNHHLSLDLSYTMIQSRKLQRLLSVFEDNETDSENGLKVLGLAYNGLTRIPTDALKKVSVSLQKLSLQGNYFSNCGNDGSNRCILPQMNSLKEINLRNSGFLEFPCQLFSKNTPNLDSIYLDQNSLSDLACSEGVNISFLSMRSMKTDGLGFQLCHYKSKCVFPNLVSLDLSHTKISSLNFLNLTSLENLSLCNTGIQVMDDLQPLTNLRILDIGFNKLNDTFKFPVLSNLEELHVQSCAIENILNDSFENLTNLHTLNMSQNLIREINEYHFTNLQNLTTLIIQDNRIRPWKTSVLNSTNKLNFFNFQSNWLVDITYAMIQDMKASEKVDLSFNPFSCIPRVCKFFESYNKSKMRKLDNGFHVLGERYNFTLLNWNELVKTAYICTTDDNEQKPLREYCEPTFAITETSTSQQELTTNSSSTEVDSGENNPEIDYTLIYICVPTFCTLTGTAVCYWKRVNIRMFALTFKKRMILTTLKDKNKSYQYDVFLSYSDKDRDWILDQCIPNIEQQNNIKVCLHERDFQAGVPVLENIMACMDKSRCVLLVLSEAFLRSHWCQFELSLAQHRLLEMQNDRLILVLLEHIPRGKCSKMLRYLMLTKTYLQWPVKDKEEGRSLFWCQLKKAIQPIHGAGNVSLA